MWQIKKKMEDFEKQRQQLVEELIREKEFRKIPAEPPNVLVEAVASGGPADGKAKPLVKHVIVKDINRVAQMKNIEFPTGDLFANKAPIGLYALFDGQACASAAPGPAAAEYCARNLHTKVMDNLAMLKQGSGTEAYVKAALIKSFHDLDADFLATTADIQDGCGAAVALVVGDHVFLASLGRCIATLAEVDSEGDRPRPAEVRAGGQAAASGCLGGPARKRGGPGAPGCTPEVVGTALKGFAKHPFLMLGSSTVRTVLDPSEFVGMAADFRMQPRFAVSEISARVLEEHARRGAQVPPQIVVAQACFLPPKEGSQAGEEKKPSIPPAKKARVGLKTLRLRHILLKVQDAAGKQPAGPAASASAGAKAKPARPRAEAEGMLRDVLKELCKDLSEAAKAPKTPTDLIIFQGKKFAELCKKMSDCPTAQKGGAMCGDLGWMSLEELGVMGGNLREKVEPLKQGQWSDIVLSDKGMHLIQRVA